MDIHSFWKAVLCQDRKAISAYFQDDAYVNWHCTNEHFTVDEFIIANCDYPGEWEGDIQKICAMDDLIITVTLVYPKDRSESFYVTSFFGLKDEKISSVDEYWADNGNAPEWRQQKHLGKAINPL